MTAPTSTIVLDGLPADLVEAAVTYLGDMLRECQLVLVDDRRDASPRSDLLTLARCLVPDLEEVRDLFRAGTVTTTDGVCRVEMQMHAGHAGTLAHLQMQLVQLRLLARRGGMLTASDPRVTQLLAWIWDEASDQIHGRTARPYRFRELA